MKTALLFPGQGSQFVGMAEDLYNSDEDIKKTVDELKSVLPEGLLDIMFKGPEDTLKQTLYTQPAIFIHSIASLTAINKRYNIKPYAVCGHSVGEYAALCAAGVLSYQDGAMLISSRAKFMNDAAAKKVGTMAAVLGLEDKLVDQICKNVDGIVIAANFNCPGQVVISGEKEAVDKACEELKDNGAKKVVSLVVSGAWHSPLMQEAQDKLEEVIEKTQFKNPECYAVSNVDAKSYNDGSIIKNNLKKQICSAVQWTASMQNLINDGVELFIEIGPGKVLSGLLKRIDRSKKIVSISSVEDLEKLDTD